MTFARRMCGCCAVASVEFSRRVASERADACWEGAQHGDGRRARLGRALRWQDPRLQRPDGTPHTLVSFCVVSVGFPPHSYAAPRLRRTCAREEQA
eukprot:237913-Rhodomonas_salina.3